MAVEQLPDCHIRMECLRNGLPCFTIKPSQDTAKDCGERNSSSTQKRWRILDKDRTAMMKLVCVGACYVDTILRSATKDEGQLICYNR